MNDKLQHLEETLNLLSNMLSANQKNPNRDNYHKEGSNGGRQIISSKTEKLDFPWFSGDDPTEWFNRVEQFFEYLGTVENQKVPWLLTDTTKRLMSSSKCRSVEVINNPARPRSNHREVNYINYK